MCGRVWLAPETDLEKYRKILADKFDQETLKLWKKIGEFYPSDLLLVIDSANNITLMKWGYDVFTRKVINTRIESIRDKKIYTEDYLNHRCLIPASGFYEWDSNKRKCYFHTDDSIFYLAGIYQETDGIEQCSILTKEATSTKAIHNRIPIVMNRQQAASYLNKPDFELLTGNAPDLKVE